MRLDYADRELERKCTDERYMQRKLGAQVAKALKLRITELRYATEMADLLAGTGRWEELSGDLSGKWSARLTANWRLVVRPGEGEAHAVIVVEIVDYHRR
ncbi:proteic killer suppression protein [Sanguibacter gelidistatuariae]|uniref:Endoribonuclease YoeB n=1 Tax=Sanguibacter gelidistatuariae TaxID=1814289 RepID=A0A1G6L804_9MICO|nr:type II toxin-antitoxin system RelE/ParE family toxin [Sanguibacter gelidistatuariae]SDC39247.1 proteic killer suppression protein [Sanguibacter gelidistatuariae]